MDHVRWFAVPSPKLGTESMQALGRRLSTSRSKSIIFQQEELPKTAAIGSFVNEIIRQARDITDASEVAVLTHSAAGLLVPGLARVLVSTRQTRFRYLHLDTRLSARRVSLLGDLTAAKATQLSEHGRLPKWSAWTTQSRWEAMIPNARLRVTLDRSLPELPLSFTIEEFDYNPNNIRDAAYVQLSDNRTLDADLAVRLGWRVVRAPEVGHMAPVDHPDALARLCWRALGADPEMACE
jgi:hypothetical protein